MVLMMIITCLVTGGYICR